MKKNNLVPVVIVLVVLSIAEGYYIVKERNAKNALSMIVQSQTMTAPPTKKPAPMFVIKGRKFADNPLFQKAYLIAPVTGELSVDAKKALTGWVVNTTDNPDGSFQVDLSPQETGDIKQQFTLKPGYKLYFIELSPADDSATEGDANRGDDIGVLVDQNGIVQ